MISITIQVLQIMKFSRQNNINNRGCGRSGKSRILTVRNSKKIYIFKIFLQEFPNVKPRHAKSDELIAFLSVPLNDTIVEKVFTLVYSVLISSGVCI